LFKFFFREKNLSPIPFNRDKLTHLTLYRLVVKTKQKEEERKHGRTRR